MAATTSSPLTFLCSSTQRKSTTTRFTFSPSAHLCPQTPQSRFSSSALQLGHALSSQWNGLRRVGLSIKQKAVKIERRGRCRRMVVYASLFGVGAPEALVIGVVALLVFGPKGLAEVARNLGKTLRSFQPTIRELQEVSREFKSTLEREIGLDDIPPTGQNSNRSAPTATSTDVNKENSQGILDPNGVPASNALDGQSQVQDGEPTTEKPFNIGELLVEAQRKSLQQSQSAPPENQAQPQPEAQPQEAAPTAPQPIVSEVPQPTVSEVPQPESQPQEAAPTAPQPTVSEVPPTTPQTKQEN